MTATIEFKTTTKTKKLSDTMTATVLHTVEISGFPDVNGTLTAHELDSLWLALGAIKNAADECADSETLVLKID